jgi:hypothetical protein
MMYNFIKGDTNSPHSNCEGYLRDWLLTTNASNDLQKLIHSIKEDGRSERQMMMFKLRWCPADLIDKIYWMPTSYKEIGVEMKRQACVR